MEWDHVKRNDRGHPYYWEKGKIDITMVSVPTRLCECCYQPDKYLIARHLDGQLAVFSLSDLLYEEGFNSIEDIGDIVYNKLMRAEL